MDLVSVASFMWVQVCPINQARYEYPSSPVVQKLGISLFVMISAVLVSRKMQLSGTARLMTAGWINGYAEPVRDGYIVSANS
jgi:hypothetical protein